MILISCPNCGESLPERAIYCPRCGKSLTSPAITPVAGPRQFFSDITADLLHTDHQFEDADESVSGTDDWNNYNSTSWHKVLSSPASRSAPAPLTPRSLTALAPPQLVEPLQKRRKPPFLYFWLTLLVLLCLIFGGLFGLFLLRASREQLLSDKPVLHITPSYPLLGARITLSGSNFTPHGKIGLTRDGGIPVSDINNQTVISADGQGSFKDLVFVDPQWQPGSHTIAVEDATSHKIARFTIVAMGSGTSLRPAHLVLSATALDLGAGDQATNSVQEIVLSNAGGGEISWQSTSTQPSWLLLSPTSGILTNEEPAAVTIAIDRSNLALGAYSGNILFTSNAGKAALSVQMYVTPLQPGHRAVLQLTPAVLSFSGTDGGSNPPGQVITVSNPGAQPLQWQASASTGDGSNWLSISSSSGSVPEGNSQSVTVGANISTLLPGTYTGVVTFTTTGSQEVEGSPQSISVSLTILPQCSLQVSPGDVTFAGAYLQPAPASESVTLAVSQGCSAPLSWTASITTTNGGQWLSMNTTSGTTPDQLSLAVNTVGLSAGTYTGSVVFTTVSGSQTVPVTFILGPALSPVLQASPDLMNFNGTLNQSSPAPQAATLSNTGGGTMHWQATATTSVGGLWLTVSPLKGRLAANQSTTITVTAKLLASLIPGTYTGTVTITATDDSGNSAIGSPQQFPVTFVVGAPCGISVAPAALSFTGAVGQSNPAPQSATITAGGACGGPLSWTATTSAAWLTVTPTTGSVSLSASAPVGIGVASSGLNTGTYTGSVTITATDSVTNQQVGPAQVIPVSLTVQSPCTLQAPSVANENFTTGAGLTPNTRRFTIRVTGVCGGKVTVIPTVSMGSGSSWLAVTPSSEKIASGGNATFTIAVTSASLSPGSYNADISLAAVNGGMAIAGSPENVGVTLKVLAASALSVGPSGLSFKSASGTSTKPITIANVGGGPFNWTAALDPAAPSFVSLSASSGSHLKAGKSTSIRVIVDAAGVNSGTYTTSVTISAIDPITGNAVAGSPTTIPIRIHIASAPKVDPSKAPMIQLNTPSLSFKTKAGNNQLSRNLTISNTGSSTLTWTVGQPTVNWLTMTPASGSDPSGASSKIKFTVDAKGLAKGKYTVTVVIKPARSAAVGVTVNLKVN